MKQKILYIGVAAVLSLTACNDSFWNALHRVSMIKHSGIHRVIWKLM